MAVRFVLGRAASGKSSGFSREIIEAMRADPLGSTIFLIVPKQATFSAERELTCASGLPGFCRTRVVSFDDLGDDILAECGGAAVPLVTRLGRQMVLGHLLRRHEPELRYFKSIARQPGLAAELDATFAELERCGKSSDDLAAVVAESDSAASFDAHGRALVWKLHDLQLLYDAYTKYLGQERLDQHRRLAQVLDSLQSCRQVRNSTIYVDGFLEFTEYERQMLAGLAKVCGRMQIALLVHSSHPVIDDPHQLPDELELFHRTLLAYRKLWFAFHENDVAIDAPVRLSACGLTSTAIADIERVHFARKAQRSESNAPDAIALVEAPDRRAEITQLPLPRHCRARARPR
jgi:ATP-dependent helicase/nuclease subunit B